LIVFRKAFTVRSEGLFLFPRQLVAFGGPTQTVTVAHALLHKVTPGRRQKTGEVRTCGSIGDATLLT